MVELLVVPYERFVIRISEEDFLKDPHYCLDYVKNSFLNANGTNTIRKMRAAMEEAAPLLSFRPIRIDSAVRHKLLSMDPHIGINLKSMRITLV